MKDMEAPDWSANRKVIHRRAAEGDQERVDECSLSLAGG